jgi:apolipoprotein N-acyltransferase
MDGTARDVDVEGYLVGHIPLTSERSLYNQYGDWFVYVISVMIIGMIIWSLFIRRHVLK